MGARLLSQIVVLSLGTALAVPAVADTEVIYRQEIVGGSRILVPRAVEVTSGRVLVERVAALFARLKSEKPSAYGQASLDLSAERAAELERSRIATVVLDPDRPRSRDEVLGELVYTFATAGVALRAGESGETPRLLRREDIPTPAYLLVLPFHLALPPSPFGGALARLPEGRVASVEDLEQRLRKGEKPLVDEVLRLADDKRASRRLRAVRALGYLPGEIARPRLLKLLRDPERRVQVAAVDGLSTHPQPEVLAALERLLTEDRDDDVRTAAARALVQSGQKQPALAGITFLLKSPDPERKVVLLRRLKGVRLEGIAQTLLPLLGEASARVRVAALEVLAERTETKILEAVQKLCEKDEDREVRATAARVLQRSGERRFVARGLAHDLAFSDEERARSAAEQLGGLGGEGREALEAALTHASASVRAAAATSLRRIGDARALPALARAAQAGLSEAERAAAAILANQPPAELARLIADSEEYLKRMAIVTAAGSRDPAVQKAVASAAESRARSVRRVVAETLGKIGGEGAVPALSRLLEDEDDQVRRAAALGLGEIGDPASWPTLLRQVKYGNLEVRRAVFKALARLRGAPSLEAVGALLDALYDEDPTIREHALWAVAGADKKNKRILAVVLLQLKDTAEGVRRAAVRAVGMLGDSKNISNLEDALTDESPAVRLAAIEGLETIGGAAAAVVLERHAAREKDRGLAARAREAAAKIRANASQG
jgi:HEAT repeat protein